MTGKGDKYVRILLIPIRVIGHRREIDYDIFFQVEALLQQSDTVPTFPFGELLCWST